MSTMTVVEPARLAAGTKPKDKSKKRDKDRAEKRSLKKRQREDEATQADTLERPESPSKRARSSAEGTLHWRAPAAQHNAQRTPIHQQVASFYLPLSPVSLRHPLKGLCAEHLSPLILTYHPPVDGIVLGYSNVKLSSEPPISDADTSNTTRHDEAVAQQIDEYAASFVWLTATFLVLRLEKDLWLDSTVNLQNESHLGLIVWNLFAASIPRERLPKAWRWRDATPGTFGRSNDNDDYANDEHGYFLDGAGKKLPRQITFRVRDFEAAPAAEGDRGMLSIGGTLLSREEEEEIEEVERERENVRREQTARDDQMVVQMAVVTDGEDVLPAVADDESAGDDEPQTSPQTAEHGSNRRHRVSY